MLDSKRTVKFLAVFWMLTWSVLSTHGSPQKLATFLGKPVEHILRNVGSSSSVFLDGVDDLGVPRSDSADIILSYPDRRTDELLGMDALADLSINIETNTYKAKSISVQFGTEPAKPATFPLFAEELLRIVGKNYRVIMRSEIPDDGGLDEFTLSDCNDVNGRVETWYFPELQMEATITRTRRGEPKLVSLFFAKELKDREDRCSK